MPEKHIHMVAESEQQKQNIHDMNADRLSEKKKSIKCMNADRLCENKTCKV